MRGNDELAVTGDAVLDERDQLQYASWGERCLGLVEKI
jgi:hypothetical protein